ncbi:MAG: hypothetical protein ACQPRH_04445 [Solitalea-like symbiont of Tyrophagus putrescentiae]
MVHNIKMLNIAFSFNIVRITEYSFDSLRKYLDNALFVKPNVLYIADSNGNLSPETTEVLLNFLKSYDIPLGFHGHNNLDLAVANSITAIKSAASFIDASIAGLGKGTGNLKLESLISYINSLNPGSKYNLCASLEAKMYAENLSYFSKVTNPTDIIMGHFNLSQAYINKLDSKWGIQTIFNTAQSLKAYSEII